MSDCHLKTVNADDDTSPSAESKSFVRWFSEVLAGTLLLIITFWVFAAIMFWRSGEPYYEGHPTGNAYYTTTDHLKQGGLDLNQDFPLGLATSTTTIGEGTSFSLLQARAGSTQLMLQWKQSGYVVSVPSEKIVVRIGSANRIRIEFGSSDFDDVAEVVHFKHRAFSVTNFFLCHPWRETARPIPISRTRGAAELRRVGIGAFFQERFGYATHIYLVLTPENFARFPARLP
jgi:hypothetical protein